MIFTNKYRLFLNKYSFLETFVILSGFIFVGYLIDNKDPILLNYEIVYIAFILIIVTLFHGIANGLFSLFFLALVMKYFYPIFPTEPFLNISIVVLILGEFHYFWNKKILQNSSKNAYLRNKLDELSNAFYTLKISHDQLEKNYVFKPMSLRNSIRVLKDSYESGENYNKEFLTLLQKSFSVSEAELYIANDSKLYLWNDTNFENSLDIQDSMLEMALEKKSPIYVSSDEVENNSEYLAVIPGVSNTRVKGVLLIKKMPFLSFNKDTLITISVLISYFLDELEKWDTIELSRKKNNFIDASYQFELDRLSRLYKDFDVESTVLVIKTKDELLAHLIEEKLVKSLRSLDISTAYKSEEFNVISVLFPFADDASARGFLVRLFKLLKLQEDDERISFSFFDISKLEIINRYSEVRTIDV